MTTPPSQSTTITTDTYTDPTTPFPEQWQPNPPAFYKKWDDDSPRLFLPLDVRLLLTNFCALSLGFTLGAAVGHKKTSLRFRAENAHRLPKSQTGWYFYHKSKNYHMLRGGLKEGFLSSVRLMGLASFFVVTEAGIDGLRQRTDAVGTTVAGGVTGAAFGLISNLQRTTIGLTTRRGLWYGLLYGIAQDIVRKGKGESVFYMDPFYATNGVEPMNQEISA